MNTPVDRIAEAEAARDAFAHFVGPALSVCRADYLTKLADIAARPMTEQVRAGMAALATGIKVVDEIEAQLRALMSDGEVARRDTERASRLANMTADERRWFQFAPTPL